MKRQVELYKNVKLGFFAVVCLEDCYEKGQSKYFLRKCETSAKYTYELNFGQKNYSLYVIRCSY